MSSLPFWSRACELVLWAQLISVWSLCNYGLAPDTSRTNGTAPPARNERLRTVSAAALAATGAALLPPPATGALPRLVLGTLLGLLTACSIAGRSRLTRSARGQRWLMEWELALVSLLVVGSALAISALTFPAAPPASLLRSGRAAAVLTIAGSLCFAFRGGTYLVRGVLDKVGARPTVRPSSPAPVVSDGAPQPLDLGELNRGRSIGNLERLLMVMVVGAGNYQALAFLIAAKGLIRAREFEDRNFAEYFILGSLTSAAVALPLGMLLQASVPILWALTP
jgi:hypothetical protein